ncbi:unnamed protein product [Spirodela intermedia]|uniref:Uncharacterized protein n=1 Tax=Spirodela intermedia TaxID=51605 RepID=A0A7I8III4_SPIIN|nr:unnamed protein product [Spirodela intermedia]CAA6657685.1 unnamed protein product [Spirodela intermedia]
MDDSMASVPETSPTGRRRLVELLKERQEPFLLAVYLLENGCRAERIPPPRPQRLHRIAGHGLRKRKKEGPASLVAAFLHWRCPPPKGWNRNRRGDLGSTFESGTSPCSVGSIRVSFCSSLENVFRTGMVTDFRMDEAGRWCRGRP